MFWLCSASLNDLSIYLGPISLFVFHFSPYTTRPPLPNPAVADPLFNAPPIAIPSCSFTLSASLFSIRYTLQTHCLFPFYHCTNSSLSAVSLFPFLRYISSPSTFLCPFLFLPVSSTCPIVFVTTPSPLLHSLLIILPVSSPALFPSALVTTPLLDLPPLLNFFSLTFPTCDSSLAAVSSIYRRHCFSTTVIGSPPRHLTSYLHHQPRIHSSHSTVWAKSRRFNQFTLSPIQIVTQPQTLYQRCDRAELIITAPAPIPHRHIHFRFPSQPSHRISTVVFCPHGFSPGT